MDNDKFAQNHGLAWFWLAHGHFGEDNSKQDGNARLQSNDKQGERVRDLLILDKDSLHATFISRPGLRSQPSGFIIDRDYDHFGIRGKQAVTLQIETSKARVYSTNCFIRTLASHAQFLERIIHSEKCHFH